MLKLFGFYMLATLLMPHQYFVWGQTFEFKNMIACSSALDLKMYATLSDFYHGRVDSRLIAASPHLDCGPFKHAEFRLIRKVDAVDFNGDELWIIEVEPLGRNGRYFLGISADLFGPEI